MEERLVPESHFSQAATRTCVQTEGPFSAPVREQALGADAGFAPARDVGQTTRRGRSLGMLEVGTGTMFPGPARDRALVGERARGLTFHGPGAF